MNSSTITVHWHDDNQPVYSVAFQPTTDSSSSPRLATGGGDNNVRIWNLSKTEKPHVEYLSTLRKHTQAVNSVRFNPTGDKLATAGDDGSVIIWTLSPTIVKEFGESDDDVKELWIAKLVLRSLTLEIYDISWSPDGRYVAAGSMDHFVRIYDIEDAGNMVLSISGHQHYVQGIAWDPLGIYVVSQLADRSVAIHELVNAGTDMSVAHSSKVYRAEVPVARLGAEATASATENGGSSGASLVGTKTSMLYHSETLQSFFRRPAFSPDGNIILTPAGVYRSGQSDDDEVSETNTVYVYIRTSLNKPIVHLPGLKRPAVATAFSPVVYEAQKLSVFDLPYKMIFCVATQDSVIIYDTCQFEPLGVVLNLHYATITDLAWDKDGQRILVSSADGFCSAVSFRDGVFGSPYTGGFVNQKDIHKAESVKNLAAVRRVDKTESSTAIKYGKNILDEITLVKQANSNGDESTSVLGLLKKKEKNPKKRVAPTLVE